LKLYADEGIDRQIVDALRSAGFDVAYAAESDPSVADDALLAKAAAEGRLLLTSDKDFGELVFRLKKINDGVVLIRLFGLSAGSKARLVVEAFSTRSDKLARAFSVLSPGILRIRAPRTG
jgi:predicted nuclease of predicted toxin-antitoxin system